MGLQVRLTGVVDIAAGVEVVVDTRPVGVTAATNDGDGDPERATSVATHGDAVVT